MYNPPDYIDEYTLADFIAGNLTGKQHADVIAYLANNADARELLRLASAALEEAKNLQELAETESHGFLRAPFRSDRMAVRSPLFYRRIKRYAVATLMVFAVGIGLRLLFFPVSDPLRNGGNLEILDVSIHVNQQDLQFEWTGVEDAFRYRLVVWDVLEAHVVGRYETRSTYLDRENDFIIELLERLEPGRTYTLRIDAVDAQNRMIRSSTRVEFQF